MIIHKDNVSDNGDINISVSLKELDEIYTALRIKSYELKTLLKEDKCYRWEHENREDVKVKCDMIDKMTNMMCEHIITLKYGKEKGE